MYVWMYRTKLKKKRSFWKCTLSFIFSFCLGHCAGAMTQSERKQTYGQSHAFIWMKTCFFAEQMQKMVYYRYRGCRYRGYSASPFLLISPVQHLFPEKLSRCQWLPLVSEMVVKCPCVRLPLATITTAVIIVLAVFNLVRFHTHTERRGRVIHLCTCSNTHPKCGKLHVSWSTQCFNEKHMTGCSSDTVHLRTNDSDSHGLDADLSYLPVSDGFLHVKSQRISLYLMVDLFITMTCTVTDLGIGEPSCEINIQLFNSIQLFAQFVLIITVHRETDCFDFLKNPLKFLSSVFYDVWLVLWKRF